jgi:hypothetical protein
MAGKDKFRMILKDKVEMIDRNAPINWMTSR